MTEKVAILGAGESGTGAAILAKKEGYEVWVSDFGTIKATYKKLLEKHEIAFEEGGHTEQKILDSDLIIKSPGIPETAGIVKQIREKSIRLISEIEFASWYTDAMIIGITGSNGKTTVTSLIYHILKNAGVDVGLGGNIGHSFAELVATTNHSHYVIEISNFQLDDIEKFRPHIALLLNITPDHLDRYGYQMEGYIDSKFRIAENQTEEDYFLYCLEDPVTMEHLERKNIKAQKLGFGLEKQDKSISWIENNTTIEIQMEQERFNYNFDHLRLKGRHNAYNTMAAAIVARIIEVRKDNIRESLMDFKSVEHRLEPVAHVGGIEFINDSKATNVNSAWFALESVNDQVVWIMGGVDKGNDYQILVPMAEKKVKAIIILGSDTKKIHEAFGKKVGLIVKAESMKDAVNLSYHFADKDDTVLLSPACASFDMFDNYEHRGREFKKYVKNL